MPDLPYWFYCLSLFFITLAAWAAWEIIFKMLSFIHISIGVK